MIDIFAGEGAHWSPMTINPTDIAAALEALTEAEREAQNDRIKRVRLWSLSDALALAELDVNRARASRLRMTLAAAEMMDVCEDIVDLLADRGSRESA